MSSRVNISKHLPLEQIQLHGSASPLRIPPLPSQPSKDAPPQINLVYRIVPAYSYLAVPILTEI